MPARKFLDRPKHYDELRASGRFNQDAINIIVRYAAAQTLQELSGEQSALVPVQDLIIYHLQHIDSGKRSRNGSPIYRSAANVISAEGCTGHFNITNLQLNNVGSEPVDMFLYGRLVASELNIAPDYPEFYSILETLQRPQWPVQILGRLSLGQDLVFGSLNLDEEMGESFDHLVVLGSFNDERYV